MQMVEDSPIAKVSMLILSNATGDFLFQLRDNDPTILHPSMISGFGGHLEKGETFEQGVRREIAEELSVNIDHTELALICSLRGWFLPKDQVEFSAFRLVINNQNDIKVTEGKLLQLPLEVAQKCMKQMTPLTLIAFQYCLINEGMIDL